jgi:lysophospholipase L1-like esterase
MGFSSHARAHIASSSKAKSVKTKTDAGRLESPPTTTPSVVSLRGGSIAIFSWIAAVIVTLVTTTTASNTKSSMLVRPEFVLLGDSITQQSFQPGGWGAAVACEYQRTADVRLRGYSGYNTRWALPLLPDLFPSGATAPALVTVFFGANDANLPAPLRGQPEAASRQHVPLDEYVENLRQIVRVIKGVGDGSARVLLVTPPPCDEDAWHAYCVKVHGAGGESDPNRSFKGTRSYSEAVKRLATEIGTPALDLHAAFVRRDDWRELFLDGLHPNGKGSEVIASSVIGAIQTHWPELRPASYADDDANKLPLDFPDHKAVDAENVRGGIAKTFTDHAAERKRRLGA